MLKNTLPLKSEFTNSSPLDSSERFNMIFEQCGDKFHCKFCDIQINDNELVKHAESHVMIPWDRVSNAYNKYEIFFENFILRWKDLFRCCLCKITFDEWSVALVHITDKTHRSLTENSKVKMNDDFLKNSNVTFEFLVAEGLFAFDLKTFRCVICDVQNVSIGQINRHVKGLVHSWNKKKFSLDSNETDKIIPQEIPIENSGNASENNDFPISGETTNCTSIADNFWIVEEEGNSFHCVICNCIFPNTREALNIHLMGMYHQNSKKRHGCSHIVRQNGRFYCEICNDDMMIDDDVRIHVLKIDHVDSLMGIEEKTMGEENPENASSTESSEISRIPSNRKFPNFYILKIDDEVCRCVVCDIVIAASIDLAEEHIAGESHAERLQKYGCHFVTCIDNGAYYCDVCRDTFTDLEILYRHVRREKHLTFLETMANDVPSNEITDDSPRNQISAALPRIKMADNQPRNKMEDDVPRNKTADDQPRNKIADDQPRNKMADDQPRNEMADDQLRNKMADQPRNKMVDDQRRNELADYQPRNKMADHLPRIKMADDLLKNKMEDKTKDNNENKMKETVETNLIKIGKISLQENHPKFGDWITKISDIKARCEICNCAVSPLIHNIDIHVMGKTHALSLRRHGCEYITMRKKNKYHCDCCDIDMSKVEEIYRHVRSNEHAKILDLTMQRKILQVKRNISGVKIGDKVFENFKISKNLEGNIDNRFSEDSLGLGKCDPDVIDVMEDHQYHCNCCDRTICGIDNLIQHCNGKKHLAANRSLNRSIEING